MWGQELIIFFIFYFYFLFFILGVLHDLGRHGAALAVASAELPGLVQENGSRRRRGDTRCAGMRNTPLFTAFRPLLGLHCSGMGLFL